MVNSSGKVIKNEDNERYLKQLEDEIVISGVSGRFPGSNSIEEFKENLVNGNDLLAEQTRFKVGNKLPPRLGFINSLEKFDAEFFGLSDRLTNSMDPSLRILLEVTTEAIVDAGINPTNIRGYNTGVYVACDGADGASYWRMKHGSSIYDGYPGLGTPIYMQANQVSYLFDLKGSSMAISTACSSSLSALDTAVTAMRSGKVEQAILGATCIHLVSHNSDDLNALGALSPTGYCKPFDKDANGYVRSEAIVAILLEKKSAAKRNYATVRHILTNSDGIKKEGIFCPSSSSQEELYRKVCSEASIDPAEVFYVETHGTGTQAGDPQELRGLYNFYSKAPNRTQPLLVGSVKGNMGHAESAAGLVSIAKILVAAQEGVIPPTIHFNAPNNLIAELFDNGVQVVTEKTCIGMGVIVGVSAFGFGGTNAHLILELNSTFNSKKRRSLNLSEVDKPLPVLVALSGRTKKSLQGKLEKAMRLASNQEFCSLLHHVFKERIPSHDWRAFGMIPQSQIYSETNNAKPFTCTANMPSHENRPLWLVFSGMGSQWSGMGADLMRIEPFRESIQRSEVTMKNAGVDLNGLLERSNQSIFENIRDALNAICAMQVALYDTLMSLGVRPKGYFGHSFGEIMCAYADGLVTAEQAILLVDALGRATLDTKMLQNLPPGAMAAVGLPMSDLKLRCPPDVTLSCHNAPNNVTVSGPKIAVSDFVRQLRREGVLAEEIHSCHVAPHCLWIQPVADVYLKYMQDIYKGQGQRFRSVQWISTSVEESKWNEPLGQALLPEYFANNLVSPVLFHEAVGHVPKTAVVVEIAPKGLFYGILKSSLPETSFIVSPMRERVQDRLVSFFNSLGNMYNEGVDMNVAALYPPVKFPVGAGTPSLNSVMDWKHDTNWIIPVVENSAKYINGVLNVDLNDISFKYLEGHKLDDCVVFPATGYLVFAWKTLASTVGRDYQEFPVAFENVFFKRATFLSHDKPTQLRCSIHEGTGSFEIHENGMTVVTGTITSQLQLIEDNKMDIKWQTTESAYSTSGFIVESADLYKELSILGYDFQGEFRSVKQVAIEGQRGVVSWKANWTSFLDSVLQACSITISESSIRPACVPVRLQAAIIDPKEFFNYLRTSGTDSIPVLKRSNVHKWLAPGVEFHKMSTVVIQRKSQLGTLCVSEYKFSPYIDDINIEKASALLSDVSLKTRSLESLVDIVLENSIKKQLQAYDIVTSSHSWVGPSLTSYLSAQPNHEVYFTTTSTETEIVKIRNIFKENAAIGCIEFVSSSFASDLTPECGTADLVLVDDLKMIKAIAKTMKDGSYIILKDETNGGINNADIDSCTAEAGLQLVAQKFSMLFNYYLLKKIRSTVLSVEAVFIDSTSNFGWVSILQSILATPKKNSRVYLCSQNDPISGIVGFAKCLACEPGCENIRCILDPAGKLNLNFKQPDQILSGIIRNDMLINIYQNDHLGTLRHVKLRSPVLEEPTKPVKYAFLNTLTVGDLSSLNWIESPLNLNTDPKHLYKVNYASLNFRDLMLSTGKLPLTPVDLATYGGNIGFVFTGVGPDGRRVMAIASKAAMANAVHLKPDDIIIWDVPNSWTLEDAATVPIVYATAYYGLLIRAGMQPGQSVLIHSGTGGVGQAAINIALSMNCDVFTTAGTLKKREHLKKLFPSIKDDHIGNSRDCTFESKFLEVTHGKGVDFVLNSLAKDKLFASIRCLAAGGTFVEIGKFDIYKNTMLGMNHIERNVGIMAVDLLPVICSRLPGKQKIIHYFNKGLREGVIKPLERTVFKHNQVEEAFRYMATGSHVGKVLISINDEQLYKNYHQKCGTTSFSKKPTSTVNLSPIIAVPRSYFHPQKTYVVLGGLGGFGLELADWLIRRGARHMVLLSRSGVTKGYQKLSIKRWESAGVAVETNVSDLCNLDTATKFMKSYKSRGAKIGGIFNSSLVLHDALFQNQTNDTFQAVAFPKTTMTQNLDLLSRQYYPDMEYFVCFSSIYAGLGNGGQSNYGWANSCMESICKSRNDAGFYATSVQWGIVGDVGYAAEKMEAKMIGGRFLSQRVFSCFQSLDTILEHSKESSEHSKCYASYVVSQNIHSGQIACKVSLPELVARMCFIKNVNDKSIQVKTLAELGLDSLSGAELLQRLELDYNLTLPVSTIRNLQWQDLQAIADGNFSIGNQNQTIKNYGVVQEACATAFTSRYQLDDVQQTLVHLKEVIQENKKEAAGNIFLVHGGDGKASRFLPIANKLKFNVYVFQNKDIGSGSLSSVKKMADAYIQELKTIQQKGPYNLSGYSCGATLAFEIAHQLTNKYNDKVGNLVLLDGFFSMTKEMRLPNAFLLNALQYLLKYSDKEKKKYLEILQEKEADPAQHTVKTIMEMHLKSHTKQVKQAMDCIISSKNLFFCYNSSHWLKLDANVFLIRANGSFLHEIGECPEYYFQAFCAHPIFTYNVPGSHDSFLDDPFAQQTADILNKILETRNVPHSQSTS